MILSYRRPPPFPILCRMTFTSRRIREEKDSAWKKKALELAPLALRLGGVAAGLYAKWKERRQAAAREARLRGVLKRIMVILLAVLMGIALLAGTVQALVGLRVITLSSFLSVTGSALPTDEHGFTNILLLGAGDRDHDGVDLTDSIMVASLDPGETKSTVMLSLPRDLYITDAEHLRPGRINELYRDEKYRQMRENKGMTESMASQMAMREVANELGKKLGLQIHRVVKVDFTAFVQAVDAFGGVDIDVPSDLVDPEYPGPNYTYETFAVSAGLHHMDGEMALKYARSRHSTSDFDRSARQQQLLQALADKARSSGFATSPGKITALLRILSEHVETTMDTREILGGAKMAEGLDKSRIISRNLNLSSEAPGGFLYPPPRDQFGGASVLLPVSIPDYPVTWKQITSFSHVLFQNRSLFLNAVKINVLNASKKSGQARKLGLELIRYGFDVEDIGNASDDRKNPLLLTQSVITAQSPGEEAVAGFLSTLLHIEAGALPAGVPPEKQMPITIVLGDQYDYTPIQDLLPQDSQKPAIEDVGTGATL